MLDGPVKILLVIRWPVGGIRTFLRYVYKTFSPSLYELTILAPGLEEAQILAEDLKLFKPRLVSLKENVSAKELSGAVFSLVKDKQYDLIHSQGLTSGICSAPASHIFRVPHLMTAHDVFVPQQFKGVLGLCKRLFLSLTVPFINNIHCVSNDVKANYLKYLPTLKFCPNKLKVILNGIEVERFLYAKPKNLRKELNLDADTFLIGFLGRFMSQKGFIYLMEAMVLLKEMTNLPKRPVIISFGEGGFIREEKERARNMGVDDSIIFMPFVSNVASVLKGLDVVVMPSLWEACPLQPMEAMVAGVPIIGTNCLGLREVLRDTPATILPVRDSKAISQKIVAEILHSSRERFEEFVPKAVTRFDVRERAQEIEKLIHEMIGLGQLA